MLVACSLWTHKPNTSAENGVFYGWYSESDCLTACLTSTSCVAFDLGPVGCVLHNNAQDLTTSHYSIGFTQFVLNRHCLPASLLSTESPPTTSILSPSPTGMSVESASIMTYFRCWKYDVGIAGKNSFFTNIVKASSLALCTSFQFRYIFNSSNNFSISLRVCVCCVCFTECEQWKRTDNIHAENGEFYPLTSIAACMDLCLSKSSCVAVDIWSGICALHLNASNLESNRVTTGVSQFVLDRSCAVSTASTTLLATVVTTTTPTSGAMHLCAMRCLQLAYITQKSC